MAAGSTPILEVKDLNVYYGQSHALQGVDLALHSGVLSVVGRNGMGKTTLCKTIMGLEPAASGSISFEGKSLVGLGSSEIARGGIGYVPQGRRLWPSLTVDEHLKLVATKGGAWTIERIYSTFPRLAERKTNGGGQLSGGEQQMLAISRALLLNPKLLIMDEPTEGLAPVIVSQVADMLIRLGQEGDIDVLVIEQNIGVATSVSEQVAIMVNGRINRVMNAGVLAADRDLQQSLLGVGRHAHDDVPDAGENAQSDVSQHAVNAENTPTKIYVSNPKMPTRWTQPVPVKVLEGNARTVTQASVTPGSSNIEPLSTKTQGPGTRVLVAGTMDTKGEELRYMRDILKTHNLNVQLVDLSTSGKPSGADVPPHVVAGFHPRGVAGVFTGDRGTAVSGMAEAFMRWMASQTNVAGIISAGGSGGTSLATPAMRTLPVGVPKLMISTVASGQVEQYVGPSDILMLHSVADVQGINSITREVLGNGAHALGGMVKARMNASNQTRADKQAIGLTMFGVTTPAVQQVTSALESDFDCLVFHATGVGGRSMEKLVDSGMLTAVVDLTTTEICDMLVGGVFPATEDRFGAIIRSGQPYIGSCGALDMVNFGAPETVPDRFKDRLFYEHNPQVTLMRTTAEENDRMGRWIGERLNEMTGPVRFYLPEGGVSLLDAPDQPFYDPAANSALFKALEETVRQTSNRQLIRIPRNINDPEFAEAIINTFRGFHGSISRTASGA